MIYWSVFALSLVCAAFTGEACSPEGLPSTDDLLAVEQESMEAAKTNRQWIFPGLRFTCTATVTAWVFAMEASDQDVVCPILELWFDAENTPTVQTDYTRIVTLSDTSYTDDRVALSQNVYQCTLLTPLMVSAGTVLGFQTSSESRIQTMNASSQTGYYQPVGLSSAFINTVFIDEVTGFVPLLAPIITIESSAPTNPPTTPTMLPSLSHYSLQPTPVEIISTSTLSPSPTGEKLITVNSAPSKADASSEVVGIVVTIVILVLVAVAILIVVIVVVVYSRKRESQRVTEKAPDSEAAVTPTSKISRVRSRNNYSFTDKHIYEDVGGMSLRRSKKGDRDYDYIDSTDISPGDKAKSYEVPQTPSSSNRDSSIYEVPDHVGDEYEDIKINGAYDTPVDAQGPARGNVESGYDTPVDALVQQGGGWTVMGEGVYETPTDADESDYTDVY